MSAANSDPSSGSAKPATSAPENRGAPASLSTSILSTATAAYECTTFASAPTSATRRGSSSRHAAEGSCERKVMRNLRQSALMTGRALTSAACSSGSTWPWKKSGRFTSSFVLVAPAAAVFCTTASATTRKMAVSLDFQLASGLAAYCASSAATYAESSCVTCGW